MTRVILEGPATTAETNDLIVDALSILDHHPLVGLCMNTLKPKTLSP
jgi:hypothetical protein